MDLREDRMLLIIGHDALDYDLIKKFNLSFADRGNLGLMKSHYGKTVPSWTSIYTGMTVEEHKIGTSATSASWRDWLYNQVPVTIETQDPSRTPRRYGREYRSLPFVWDDLNEADLTVGLYGMPLTFPPLRIRDWCVSGFPCLSDLKRIVWPAELIPHMRNYAPDFLQDIDDDFISNFHQMTMKMHEAYVSRGGLKFVHEHVKRRLLNLVAIWARFKTDVLFVGFSFVDHAGHLGITSGRQMENLYKIADYSIKAVRTIVQPEKMLVISDHGGDYVPIKSKWGKW